MPADAQPSQRERRLWRIDLNDVHVTDQNGDPLEVIGVVGAIDAELRVGVRVPTDDLVTMLKRLLDVALVDGYGETVRDEAEALLARIEALAP